MATQYQQITILSFVLALLLLSCGINKSHNSQRGIALPTNKINLSSLQDSCFSDCSVGYLLTDATSGKVLDEYRSRQYFTPASTTKLATAYLTLRYIGDTLTRFSYNVKSDSFIIRPFADPTFLDTSFEKSFTFFDSVCQQYSQAKFIVQFPYHPIPPYAMGWSWEDYSSYFFRPHTPLSVAKNETKIYFKDNQIQLPYTFLKEQFVLSSAEAKQEPLNLGIAYRDFFSNRIKAKSDTFVAYDSVNFSIFPNYSDLVEMLSSHIHHAFNWSIADNEPYNLPKWKKVNITPTKPVLRKMLVESDNFISQQLLLQAQLKNNWSYDMKDLMQTLTKNEWKDLPQPMYWIDGSGLSRYNANTPQNLVYILKKIASQQSLRYLQDILPTAGQGTLRSWKNKELKNHLFAKTGSMRGVYCLAGMLITQRNHLILFALMINGRPINDISCIQKTVYDWFLKY